MGILLTRGFAFKGCGNGFGGRQQVGINDIGGGPRAAITGIDQLQGAGGRGEADQSQLEQPSGSVVTSRSRVASEKAYLCGQRGWLRILLKTLIFLAVIGGPISGHPGDLPVTRPARGITGRKRHRQHTV